MDTSERLARIEARIDIARLSSDYCFCCDARDLDRLVALFAPDAVVTIPTFGAVAAGHDGIAALYDAQLAAVSFSNHWTHDLAIDFGAAGEARGRVMAHAEVVMAGVAYLATMHYDDRYGLIEGAWRFESRTINFLFYAPMAELPQRLCSSHSVATSDGWVAGYRSLPGARAEPPARPAYNHEVAK